MIRSPIILTLVLLVQPRRPRNIINKGLQVFKNKKSIEWEDFKKAYFDLHNKKVDNNFRSHAERTGVCKFENGKLLNKFWK